MSFAAAVWLVLTASSALALIMQPSAWTLALLLAVSLSPPLGALLAVMARGRVSLALEAPQSAEKDENLTVFLRGENRSLIPLGRVMLSLRAENRLTGQCCAMRVRLALPAKGSGEAAVTLQSHSCGEIRLRVEAARVYDLLGAVSVKLAQTLEGALTVQPWVFAPQVNLPLQSGRGEDSDRYAPDHPGQDYTDTFQVREYAPGDSLRQIHWKLSGKLDRLVVRDPGAPLAQAVALLWERSGCTAAHSDAMASVLVSLCRALLGQGVACQVVWNDTPASCAVCALRQEDELYDMLPRLLCAGPVDGGETVVETYCRLYGRPRGGKVVYLATADNALLAELCPPERLVSLLCDTDAPGQGTAYHFDPENFAQALSEIDLY